MYPPNHFSVFWWVFLFSYRDAAFSYPVCFYMLYLSVFILYLCCTPSVCIKVHTLQGMHCPGNIQSILRWS